MSSNDSLGLEARGALVAVAGPTASGKTELAAELARRLGGEVVSADSRQVYRFMDVGTAKPSAELRAEIPHHMIDVVEPADEFDVAKWRDGARAAISQVQSKGAVSLICGGTGLYIQSLVEGLAPIPRADESVRDRLRRDEGERPGILHERLRSADPESATRIHPNDTLRLVRALEVLEVTGVPMSRLQDRQGQGGGFKALILELVMDREDLHRRIEARSEAIVAAGLLDELAELRRRYPPDAKAFSAIGYREAGMCLDAQLPVSELAAAVAQATRQYAKRQLTWLRGRATTEKVDHSDVDSAVRFAQRFLDRVANGQGIG